MANLFQVKRTTVSGRTPNTSDPANTQYIDTGELALNLTDGKMFSSNGSAQFEVGANLANLKVTSEANVASLKVTGLANVSTLNVTGDANVAGLLRLTASNGLEGGEIFLGAPANTSLAGGITIDAFQNKIRFFEQGGSARGAYIDLTACAGGAGTNLLSGGGGGGSVNTEAQFAWTNNHTFSANVSFTGRGFGLTSNTGAIYLGGISDSNWRIGRNTGAFTKWVYTNNSIDIVTANSNLEGMSIGLVGGNTYFETGYLGTYIAGSVTVGNSSVNATINSTSFSGTANNALNANNSTNALNANNASFVGGNSAADLRSYSDTKASSAYANAQAYADLVSSTAYTNAVAMSSNGSNITTGTVSPSRLPLANTTSNGVVLFVDSVSNTAIEIYAPTANSVKRAYDTAVSAYSNATAYSSNATNITSGTLDAARLPATANITTAINVGANINITTSSINVGNATVNSVVNSTSATITTVNANTVLANTVNATSFTTTAFTANTTGIIPAANNTTLGTATKRWDVYGGLGNFGGSVTIDGDLTVSGNSFTVSATTLAVTDHMIYMNNGILANITAATGNGTAIVFTANNNFANGWDVFVSGVTPSSFNGTYHNITQANATHFIVANTNTDTYTSGGTARGKTDANPDIGFAAGYNDGTYRHTGFFRDATDGYYKVFDNYAPEPDASAFIDTSNNTFRIANLQANGFIAAVVNATTSVNSAVISVGTDFIANATGAYHTGTVNAAVVSTTGFSANTSKINLGVGVLANGTQGTAGQVLTTDGSNVYWSTVTGGGGGGGNSTFSITTDTFVGNGSNTEFTLSVTPAGPEYATLIIGGVTQFKNTYSVVGTTITLVAAPVSGAPIEVTTYGGNVSATSYTSTVQPFSPFLLMGAQN